MLSKLDCTSGISGGIISNISSKELFIKCSNKTHAENLDNKYQAEFKINSIKDCENQSAKESENLSQIENPSNKDTQLEDFLTNALLKKRSNEELKDQTANTKITDSPQNSDTDLDLQVNNAGLKHKKLSRPIINAISLSLQERKIYGSEFMIAFARMINPSINNDASFSMDDQILSIGAKFSNHSTFRQDTNFQKVLSRSDCGTIALPTPTRATISWNQQWPMNETRWDTLFGIQQCSQVFHSEALPNNQNLIPVINHDTLSFQEENLVETFFHRQTETNEPPSAALVNVCPQQEWRKRIVTQKSFTIGKLRCRMIDCEDLFNFPHYQLKIHRYFIAIVCEKNLYQIATKASTMDISFVGGGIWRNIKREIIVICTQLARNMVYIGADGTKTKRDFPTKVWKHEQKYAWKRGFSFLSKGNDQEMTRYATTANGKHQWTTDVDLERRKGYFSDKSLNVFRMKVSFVDHGPSCSNGRVGVSDHNYGDPSSKQGACCISEESSFYDDNQRGDETEDGDTTVIVDNESEMSFDLEIDDSAIHGQLDIGRNITDHTPAIEASVIIFRDGVSESISEQLDRQNSPNYDAINIQDGTPAIEALVIIFPNGLSDSVHDSSEIPYGQSEIGNSEIPFSQPEVGINIQDGTQEEEVFVAILRDGVSESIDRQLNRQNSPNDDETINNDSEMSNSSDSHQDVIDDSEIPFEQPEIGMDIQEGTSVSILGGIFSNGISERLFKQLYRQKRTNP